MTHIANTTITNVKYYNKLYYNYPIIIITHLLLIESPGFQLSK